ncbi:Tumor rejection antigen P815A [Apodemus speciosus]|uniref:Tumor rejection antigen P815A n=1 Tax=Apodemus speciosus TaxID=105296 RepID=A0ABQ0FVA6_APOSI
MSDNKKPDKADSGTGGEGDGNRCNFLNERSREDILRYLGWLILFVATTSSLAFHLLIEAIYEEQDERDVAWIARQSKYMSSAEGDIDYEDDYDDDYDDYDDYDDDDFYDDDEEDEELENLMEDESEEDGADDQISLELSSGATYFFDFGTCSCASGHNLRKDEVKCKIYYFEHPDFLVSIPMLPKEPTGCRCENAGEDVAMEEEEEEEDAEDDEEEEDEMEDLDGEYKKNPDSAKGPSP